MPEPTRRRRLLAAGAVLGVLALVAAGVWWNAHQREVQRQAELLATWQGELDAWEDGTIALLPDPPLRLSAQVDGFATEPVEQLDEINATCARANQHAEAVASAPPPPGPPAELSETAANRDDVEARAAADDDAVAAYQSAVAEPSSVLARFCGVYPAIAQVHADQRAALDSFGALLSACDVATTGCLPDDPSSWPEVADAVEAAYLEPTRRLAEIYAGGCPVAELEPACAARADDADASVPLYEEYVAALRDGDPAAAGAARDAIAQQREAGATAIAAAVSEAVSAAGGEPSDDAAADAAALVRSVLTSAENALLDADDALVATLA
ncbi:hypothetical protein Bcav_3040 [Beutenbergia cavernae DSM 12333]|uniref:Uncharacterized protein n=1 Tax=Beutenbergia cavernae (strain ATCC BAA-8 / DSM 12333 / CCUG 43141 / JCM 11478 / NBRC 16432 / NCIMB 13614 / HKI 0122) TaxID=471853 RepID=C5BZV4_BEUC1|nr:hypothetical protein [Beutenbergia cavernae]ACQ81284.1 hypothetical protein Bcav_3040 [Beutenbergia cavernae DSM 12333]